MIYEVQMPRLGITMEEGMIVNWFKKEGEKVKRGEPLLEIVTEKVSYVIEATVSGLVRKINYAVEDIVKVGETMAIIEVDEGAQEEV